MGYIKHNAICVTCFDKEQTNRLHDKAKEIFGELVTEIIESAINQYYSFFVAPDGSKEGWKDSDEYDIKRKKYKQFIKENNHNFLCEYVDVTYDEYGDCRIED